jgi:hypothetical protein
VDSANLRQISHAFKQRHEHLADQSRTRSVSDFDNSFPSFFGAGGEAIKSLRTGLFKEIRQVFLERGVAEILKANRGSATWKVPF